MKHFIFFSLLAVCLASCLTEDELKKPFLSFHPENLNDGWEISNPEYEGFNKILLEKVYTDFHTNTVEWQTRSLLVFKNGKLVSESYTKDNSDRTTPRAIWSCTKQVTGILTGIAIERGIIGSVNDSLSTYLPELKRYPDKNGITIEHLLTMKSGIAFSNDGLAGQTDDILRQLPESMNDFILSLPQSNAPGEKVAYKDGDPQLIISAIQNACDKKADEWAQEVLFSKLQIKNIRWNRYKDGTTFGGFGIETTPREMAKFGQMVLDKGKWRDVQIVSEKWIFEMTITRVENLYGRQFCYLWWKDDSRNMLMMSGHGGQYVCILPEKELVVVMTAEVNTQGDFQFSSNKAFYWVDRILETLN